MSLKNKKICSTCKSLKTFNALRKVENVQSECVTEHLRKLFQEPKKSLLLQFKEAKMKKLKTARQIVNES